MSMPLVDRPLSPTELEQFRLILSTYQDGTGMLALKDGKTLPGWRDFERAIAVICNGVNQENKFIFDVLISDPRDPKIKYGISCKMRSELRRIQKDGRATIELSNSSKKFHDYLAEKKLPTQKQRNNPGKVGEALIELVSRWKKEVDLQNEGFVNVEKSSYLSLLYDRKTGEYQLFWFPIDLPDSAKIEWHYSKGKGGGRGHLNGDDATGRVFEWYGDSGGQLKYYPQIADAKWASPIFRLEPIPLDQLRIGLKIKAQTYFSSLWPLEK